MTKRKPDKRPSGNRNARSKRRWGHGEYYSAGELFMAGIGALLIILVIGLVITSFLGE